MTLPLDPHIAAPPHPYRRLSSKWADDVRGVHDLRWFDTPTPDDAKSIANHRPLLGPDRENHVPEFFDHAHFLLPILFAYEMVQDLGWAEHTSDWDWYVGIQTRDGQWHGDYLLTDPDNEDPDEEDHADTFEILRHGKTLVPLEMPFGLKQDDPKYGDIEIILTNTVGSPIHLRDIAIVHINER